MNYVVMIALMLAAQGGGDPVITPPRMKPSEKEHGSCYPTSARIRNLEGRANIIVTVEPDGSVSEVDFPAGIEPWQQKAAECVLRMTEFIPGTLNGKPVAAQAVLPLHFFLTYAPGEHADISWPKLRSDPGAVEEAYRSCYPADTLATQIANYRVTIGADGRARRIKLLESGGDARLDQAGICVIRKLRFVPARRDGEDIQSTMTLPLPVRPAR